MKSLVDKIILKKRGNEIDIPKSQYHMFQIKNSKPGTEFNEIKAPNGLFGWCFVCRSEADFYSVKFRVSICGHDCVFRLSSWLSNLDKNNPKIVDRKRKSRLKSLLDQSSKMMLFLCSLGGFLCFAL